MTDQLTSDLAALRIDRAARSTSGHRWLRWIVGTTLAVVAVALVRIALPVLKERLFRTEVSVTEIASVSAVQSNVRLTATGYVVPQVEVDVSSKIAGRIEKALVREGSVVRRGEPMFELDATDLRAQVASARARAAAAKARAAEARARFAEVVLQRDRQQRLASKGAVAPATAEDLAARARSSEAQVGAAEADASAAQAEVNATATDVANTVIRAPMNGTVLTKPRQRGDVVAPGVPLARMADFTSIVVETDVPEARLQTVRTGGPCDLVLDAFPDRHWRGEVVEVSPALNRSKATATAKVRMLDRDDSVLPEMSARVSFLDAPLDPARLKQSPKRLVPSGAIAERAGSKVVFVVESGIARAVPIRAGGAMAGGFELLEGPAAGTRIVNDPPATLADGQSIREKSPE